MDKLFNIVSNLGSPKILVIGDLMLDKYVWGEVKRISQEGPHPNHQCLFGRCSARRRGKRYK